MMLKVTKLDRRYSLHQVMTYFVEPTLNIWGSDARIEKFKEWRNWCWEVFGPGTESKWLVVKPVAAGNNGECRMESTVRWCWQSDKGEMRIYFKDDETLSAFVFQWQ